MKALREAAHSLGEERHRVEAERRAAAKIQRDRETAIAREKYLDALAKKGTRIWDDIEELIHSKQPKNYNEAVELLVDLQDLSQRSNQRDEFSLQMVAIREKHSGKPSLMQRLKKAGL